MKDWEIARDGLRGRSVQAMFTGLDVSFMEPRDNIVQCKEELANMS